MEGLEKEIFELECSHLQPDVRISKQKIGEVLDEDFYEFGSSGKVWKRSDFDKDYSLSPDQMEMYGFELHKLGPEAVLTTYRLYNKTLEKSSIRSSIWKKRKSGWKLFFHQGTVSEQVFEDSEKRILNN